MPPPPPPPAAPVNLHLQHCLHHDQREAVARCPHCGQFYCRECVTEHDDQIICTACLKQAVPAGPAVRRSLATVTHTAGLALSLLTGWLVFYWIGRILLAIPNDFHDGTLWDTSFWRE
jgi:hypothetical protein